jgi:hypothetical protein
VLVRLPHALHREAESKAKDPRTERGVDSTALTPRLITFNNQNVNLFSVLIPFPAELRELGYLKCGQVKILRRFPSCSHLHDTKCAHGYSGASSPCSVKDNGIVDY